LATDRLSAVASILQSTTPLIEQIQVPYSNRRSDRCGGSFARPMRLSTEVLRHIRAATGTGLFVGVAFGVGPSRPDVLSFEDQQEERGLDLVNNT